MVRPCPVYSRRLFVFRVRFRKATCVCSVPAKPLRRWLRPSLGCVDLGSVPDLWWEMRHSACRRSSSQFRETIQCRQRKASGRADGP
jgi:hypothetical protein